MVGLDQLSPAESGRAFTSLLEENTPEPDRVGFQHRLPRQTRTAYMDPRSRVLFVHP